MTNAFDLQGQVSVDYSQLDKIKPEIDRRVDGVSGTAKVEVDAQKAETSLDDLAAKSKDVRREVEKPIKLDADTAPAMRKLDGLSDAWAKKMNPAMDQVAAGLSNLPQKYPRSDWREQALNVARWQENRAQSESSKAQTGMVMGGAIMTAGVGLMGSILSSSMSAAMSDQRIKASTEQVFGDAADEYVAHAEKLADSTGFMTASLLESQIAINKMAQSMGMEKNPAQPLTQVATDIAATTGLPAYANNISAVTKQIVAGMQGTSNALLDFGIRLDDTYVLSLGVNRGFKAMGDAITPAQMAQARYNAIMQQTAGLTGKAGESSDDATRSMMQFQQSMQEAKVAVGEVFLPVVKGLADFVANMPKPMLEVGVWTGLAAGFAMTVGGAIIGIKALMVTLRELGIVSASTAVSTRAAGTAVGGAGTAAAGATAPILALAAAVFTLGMYLEHIAGQTEKATEQQEAAGARQTAIMQQTTAKRTGMGDLSDTKQAAYVATDWKMIGGELASFNMYGQRLNAEAEAWQAGSRRSGAGATVNVTLEDRTSAGVRTSRLDARSYEQQLR